MPPSPSISSPQPVSLSIVNYDSSSEQLGTAIRSVLAALGQLGLSEETPGSRLVLVDNGESNAIDMDLLAPVIAELKAAGCEFELLTGHGNVGYGSGQNLGFESGHCELHVFMNPDVELDPDSLAVGQAYLDANPDVAMISPHATDAAGDKQFLCKRYPTVFDFFLRGFMPAPIRRLFDQRLARFEMRELSESEPTKNIPIISGCFMLCRSEAISRVSGFNPHYFLYFEDFDLSLRVGHDASLAYVPAMRIKHDGGGSAGKGLRHIKMFVQSARRFFSQHGWRWFQQS